ncbi:hypothetical protein L596_023887 [Steinernema carpocapsae]|uniref:Uncharacterized protein n=1 Tax=Steinernema carpocapsae TaxID=34508 RepID=A0A4U5MFS5_STECR|nr:hypothetical protein L596_023887 [Steinernema carpocapsae]
MQSQDRATAAALRDVHDRSHFCVSLLRRALREPSASMIPTDPLLPAEAGLSTVNTPEPTVTSSSITLALSALPFISLKPAEA